VLYLLARFPSVTETFLYDEIAALGSAGVEVVPWALRRQAVPVLQPGARALEPGVAIPDAARAIGAWVRWWLRAPRAMALATRGSWRGRPAGARARLRHWIAWGLGPAAADAVLGSGARHIHAAYLGPPAAAAAVASLLTEVPYSASAHAHDIFKGTRGLKAKIEGAAFVRAISEHNRRHLARLTQGVTRPTALCVVPCGLTEDWFEPPAARPESPPTILAVAQLERYKALDLLIDAAAILRYRGVALRLVIVGEGSRRRALEARIRGAGLDGVVELAGARDRGEVRRRLDAATLFAAPGRVEPSGKKDGIPVAIVEAMARGAPVVATRISGVAELVSHRRTGLLVPPDDAGALAHALERLLGDPAARAALARQARAVVERTRRAERCAAELARLLAGERSSRPATASGKEPVPPGLRAVAPAQPGAPRVRPLQPEDRPAVVDLFARSFGPLEAAERERRWRWLLEESPARGLEGAARPFVLEREGSLVGCMVVVPMPLWVWDRSVVVHWIGATTLLPGERGAAALLMGRVREELPLSSGLPTARMLRFWRKVDRHRELLVPGELGLWSRLVAPPAPRHLPRPLRELPGRCEEGAGRSLGAALGLRARPASRLEADWDDWLRAATRGWPITLARSVALCNWLYADDPLAPCRLVLVERRGRPAGFAAIDCYQGEDGRRHAGLSDLFSARTDPAALAFTLHAALAQARRLGAVSLKALEPTHPTTRRLLRAAGFLAGRSQAHPLLLARAPDHVSPSWYADLHHWHLTRSWCDPRRV